MEQQQQQQPQTIKVVQQPSKHRGLSPFRYRGHSPFRHRGRSQSPSSHKNNERNKSPFRLRGLSPFKRRGSNSSNDSNGSGGGNSRHPRKTHNILVCHENARSIVFRDHLRHVTKIVEEEGELNDDDLSSDESDHEDDDDDDEDSDPDLSSIRQAMKESFRQSLRESRRAGEQQPPPPITEEISRLAQSLVPELVKDVTNMNVVSDQDVQIEKLHVHMTPLPQLELGRKSRFPELLADPSASSPSPHWTDAEKNVYSLLRRERACVKTMKNSEWGTFLNRFLTPSPRGNHRHPTRHDDIPPTTVTTTTQNGDLLPYNSFFTSTTLLPESGKKMRCYGSFHAYTAGVVFALPEFETPTQEEEEAVKTETWSWPAGYSAKTEFNIDERGKLINGRQEALVSLRQLRRYNDEYLHSRDHTIAGKVVKGGFNVVPFNEVYLRVGGCDRFGRCRGERDGAEQKDEEGVARSLEHGVGLPVALFIRENTIEDIISVFRIRSRFARILGDVQAKKLPLLLISNEYGIRVFTEALQRKFWKRVATNVNPFQNAMLEPLTQLDDTKDSCLQQKFEELIDLDDATVRQALTHEECARIAGGFGATDRSVLLVLRDAMSIDGGGGGGEKGTEHPEQSTHVQATIEAGLSAAVRCGDYYVARQLLILYARVTLSSSSSKNTTNQDDLVKKNTNLPWEESTFSFSDLSLLDENYNPPKPPKCPPAIDTDRLRGATNSDGLLSVLGAAQVLNGLKDGGAMKRTEDSYKAVEEWVQYGEKSVAFRLASWRELRAAEGEGHIAVADNSKLMAFMSNKAITNRKRFAQHLRQATTNGSNLQFLRTMYDIVKGMHSPCLRLELLQYILGFDNRYSVKHVRLSLELAATCCSV